jgi:hypothetical protein
MITLAQYAAFSGLASHELILGAVPSTKHQNLLSSYMFNLHRGAVAVREIIVYDLRGFLDLGATNRAADLLVVLRLFLSKYPEARCAPLEKDSAGGVLFALNMHHRRNVSVSDANYEFDAAAMKEDRNALANRVGRVETTRAALLYHSSPYAGVHRHRAFPGFRRGLWAERRRDHSSNVTL